ncbi:MAG TPA: sigma factor [Streptosporangiaceae bacterium]|nr:sigma factor [Streptosporangiaceae bacterium]
MRLGAGFDEFVRVSSGPLLRTGYLLTGDRGHAEDLLQETLLRVARHWRAARRTPEPYARRVLVNLAKDQWRALRRHPLLMPGCVVPGGSPLASHLPAGVPPAAHRQPRRADAPHQPGGGPTPRRDRNRRRPGGRHQPRPADQARPVPATQQSHQHRDKPHMTYACQMTSRREMRLPVPPATIRSAALTAAVLTSLAAPAATAAGAHIPARGSVSRAVEVSKACLAPNDEVETATGAPRYVYDVWIGCGGIGFARSTDGGRTFSKAVPVPGSRDFFSWDPAVAVGPDGTVYLAFMTENLQHMFPVVDASFNHGATFPQVSPLMPARNDNWGDRDFIAVGKTGTVYVTWDYGPSATLIRSVCSPMGSCAYKAGDVNTVIQQSTDGGKTWGPIIAVSPHFPRGGGVSAPVLVEPSGRVDLLSWGHHVSKQPSYALHPGHEFFASSGDGTTWPAHQTEVGAPAGSIAIPTWWIDGDLSRDAGGTLYATWDTQTKAGDIGWLSYSTNDGVSWSAPFRVTPDTDKAVHIVQVLGGVTGVAYVAWQTDAPAAGYATYLRPYTPGKGWLGPRITVSSFFGNRTDWPGDTFGLALLPGGHATKLALSWGSAAPGSSGSEIWAATVTLPAIH